MEKVFFIKVERVIHINCFAPILESLYNENSRKFRSKSFGLSLF